MRRSKVTMRKLTPPPEKVQKPAETPEEKAFSEWMHRHQVIRYEWDDPRARTPVVTLYDAAHDRFLRPGDANYAALWRQYEIDRIERARVDALVSEPVQQVRPTRASWYDKVFRFFAPYVILAAFFWALIVFIGWYRR